MKWEIRVKVPPKGEVTYTVTAGKREEAERIARVRCAAEMGATGDVVDVKEMAEPDGQPPPSSTSGGSPSDPDQPSVGVGSSPAGNDGSIPTVQVEPTEGTPYEKQRALNWSSLKNIAKSPLMYKWRIDHPEGRKPEFLMGGGIHCRVLEPDEFDKRYALCTVRRNKRDTAFKEWLEENPGREPLTAKEMEHVKQAGDAVLRHRVAARVLKGCRHEEPLLWTDPDTGLKCKGRVDAINPEYVVDLKSDRDPSPRKFTRHAADMLYHGQVAGMYHVGATVLRKIDGKTPPYLIAVEKDGPYDVAVYQMNYEDMAAGRNLVVSLMRKLEECIAADLWPGCAPDLLQLQLPPWAAGLQTYDEETW